ncbi:MAG: RluA family pseudouridine synthase [Candidatus Omnitrophota bacterium]
MPKKSSIKIIYEDEFLSIVNKPGGLLVVPADEDTNKDLTFFLNEMYKEKGSNIKVYPCHRLDKETSGLMIFAKGKKMQQTVMDMFRERKIKKEYIAFINGDFKRKEGTLKSYIRAAWPYANKGKKLAITKFQVIVKKKLFSVVRIQTITGRTNQIRIQFKDIGHPLVGERRFAFARDWPIKFRRTALHAYSLSFKHPVKNKEIFFQAELPEDMSLFLEKNRVVIPRNMV